ncbi:hypothetical protein [Thiothrix sp.]|jgi:hypothetical protein|uniref:hypothetical protein n=1 Tax=Thiothrix sp. TaxID=1032 RepID=UPI00257C3CF8|nr:hypothetical protein [Thiothrix sp.]
MELILGFATIVSIVAVVLAIRKVLAIYGIVIDTSGLEKWEYGRSAFNDDFEIDWHPARFSLDQRSRKHYRN